MHAIHIFCVYIITVYFFGDVNPDSFSAASFWGFTSCNSLRNSQLPQIETKQWPNMSNQQIGKAAHNCFRVDIGLYPHGVIQVNMQFFKNTIWNLTHEKMLSKDKSFSTLILTLGVVSCIVFGWNWNVEICIHSPYPKDVWLLVAHNFAYCCRCWAWCVLRPSRFSWIFWIPCRFGISTPSTAVTRESPNEWLHEEANCLTCQWNIMWQAVGDEGRGDATTQRTGERVVSSEGTSSELMFFNHWLVMINAVTHFSISDQSKNISWLLSTLVPKSKDTLTSVIAESATTRHLGFVWGQVASLHVTWDGI